MWVRRRYQFIAGRVGNVMAGTGLQNKTSVLILGHGGEGLWGKDVVFDSLKSVTSD